VTTNRDGSGTLGWDGHLLLLHRSEPERQTQLAKWVRRGLERDEKIVYAQLDIGPPQRSVLTVMADQGIDVEAMTSAGQFEVLPPTVVYGAGVDGQVELIDRALAEGYRGVRTSGEVSTSLRIMAPGEVYAGLDPCLEQLCDTYPLSTLCQYDSTATEGLRLDRATATHVAGIRESQLQTAERDGTLILTGEVDDSNELVLVSAVRAAARSAAVTTSGTLRVDLRELTFLSVGGCRALPLGTERFRRQGGRVVLLAPQGIVERILWLYGLDAWIRME
jgi:anti-anti-sigma factor